MKAIWLAVALLCVLLASPLRADGTGILIGTVINGTAGGGSTEGVEVTLRSFQGQEEREQRTTATDADGAFRFEGLETGEDWVYLVRVPYEGVSYSGGLLSFAEGQAELSAEVPVYETTTENSSIVVERAHIFVTSLEDRLTMTELYVFRNPTDRTYVGTDTVDGRRYTARILLPQGGYDLALDDGSLGGRFLSIDGGFVDTEPQWPGTTQVLFSYAVDCAVGWCDLSRPVTHLTTNLNLLVEDVGATIESRVLALQGTRQAEGQTYLNYVGHGLAPGEQIDVRVRFPGAVEAARSSPSVRTQSLPWILLGTILAGLPLVYPFWRQRIRTMARKDE
jgi:hypothetical protein